MTSSLSFRRSNRLKRSSKSRGLGGTPHQKDPIQEKQSITLNSFLLKKYASLKNTKYFQTAGYAFHIEIQHVAVGIFSIWVEKS